MGFSAIFLLGRAGELVASIWLARREKFSVSASFADHHRGTLFGLHVADRNFSWALLTVKVSEESAHELALMKNAAWYIVTVSAGSHCAPVFPSVQCGSGRALYPVSEDCFVRGKFWSRACRFFRTAAALPSWCFIRSCCGSLIAVQAWLSHEGNEFHFAVCSHDSGHGRCGHRIRCPDSRNWRRFSGRICVLHDEVLPSSGGNGVVRSHDCIFTTNLPTAGNDNSMYAEGRSDNPGNP